MNLKQLSEKLGLSQTTVSRALNGYSDVSEATRQRVAEMAAACGYRPNTMARRLAMGRADAIGLIYPLDATYLGDPRFIEMLEGLTARLNEEHIDVLIASAGRGDELETYQRLIRAHRVDGLIVARTHLHDARIAYLREAKVPFVAYGRTADAADFAWFDFDNAAGTRFAVERLVGFGHKRIAYLHANLDLTFAAQRHQGYLSAMQTADLAVDPELVREVGVQRRTAYSAATELLARRDRPTAIVVDNNQAGVGVVRAILEAGLRLGQDCSLIVYDGLPEDTLLDIANVTAIEQPTPEKVGRRLADLMLGVLHGAEFERLQTEWQPVLRAGNSDGPAPG